MNLPYSSLIEGEVTTDTALRIQKEFKKNIGDGAQQLVLYINSPGGDVDAGLLLHEVITNAGIPVLGIAQGECGSIAFTLLQACTSRCAEQDVAFLVHFLTFQTSAVVYYNRDARAAVERRYTELQEKIIQKHLERSHLSREKLLSLMLRGERINAHQAQSFGMIDGVVIPSGAVA